MSLLKCFLCSCVFLLAALLCALMIKPLSVIAQGCSSFSCPPCFVNLPPLVGGASSPDGLNRRTLTVFISSSDDAWLVLDRNGNGRIDSAKEMFGNITAQPRSSEANGFLALAEFDRPRQGGNGDGRISQRDSVFANLRLWQDVNHNGFSEATELHALPELGLAIIDLDYKESRRTDDYGNRFKYRAKVRDVRGAQVGRWAWDVFLVRQR
jgi:hypothetical protein